MRAMLRDLVTAAIAIVVLTVVFGLGYPVLMTGVGQVAFPGQANGSLITVNGKVVGSRLVGQAFVLPQMKNGKPVEEKGEVLTEPDPRTSRRVHPPPRAYNAAGTTFSNLGPNSKKTEEADAEILKANLELERPYNPGLTAPTSRSTRSSRRARGSTPRSPTPTRIQARRIARVRHLPLATVQA